MPDRIPPGAPQWPLLVEPLISMTTEAQIEKNIHPATMALAMIAAGWNVVAAHHGRAAAAVALLAALDALRDESPADVAIAETAQRLHAGGLH